MVDQINKVEPLLYDGDLYGMLATRFGVTIHFFRREALIAKEQDFSSYVDVGSFYIDRKPDRSSFVSWREISIFTFGPEKFAAWDPAWPEGSPLVPEARRLDCLGWVYWWPHELMGRPIFRDEVMGEFKFVVDRLRRSPSLEIVEGRP